MRAKTVAELRRLYPNLMAEFEREKRAEAVAERDAKRRAIFDGELETILSRARANSEREDRALYDFFVDGE